MNLKQAEAIAGKLSKPSKMPGYAYGIPAKNCPIGSRIAKIIGSVCNKCYALKGRYMFPNVQKAQEFRLASLTDPRWVEAMVFMIKFRALPYFRWHDSGDLQNKAHLDKIVEVAIACPEVKFWLPTREYQLIRQYPSFPPNLLVRASAHMVDKEPPSDLPHTSGVTTDPTLATCPAPTTNNKCGPCRACWDPNIRKVIYAQH